MSEVKALILASIGLMVSSAAASLVLAALDASGIAWGFLAVTFAGLGGWVLSGVAMRYSDREERKKREEIILSR
jgi:hypothetical protein